MKFKDLHGGQVVAIVIPYSGLQKGLRGTVIGYYASDEKVLVEWFNKGRTEEKIPIKNLIGLVEEDE